MGVALRGAAYDTGLFRATKDGRPIATTTLFNLYPLLTRRLPCAMNDRLVAHLTSPQEFWSPFPLPTVSMADPAFIVRGRGNPESLHSASHGAGRCMSRTKARATYSWKAVKQELADRGVRVLSAGSDEVPYVYKNIREVMRQQANLVVIVAQFDPKIVKMCDDGSRAED